MAAALAIHGGVITSARIAIGSVGPVPARANEAEAAVAGQRPSPRLFEAAAETAGRTAEILDDLYGSVDYKRHIVTVLAARALYDAAARAGVRVN